MAIGYLVVETTTASGLQQLPQAFITITSTDPLFRKTAQSGMNGRTEEIQLETVDKAYSLDYQNKQLPFQRYFVEVKHPGYNTSSNHIVDIFDGVKSILHVDLIPAQSQEVIPALQKAIPAIAKRSEINVNPNKTELADKIIIPEFVRIKLGPPESNAPVVQLAFIDYVKNVASQLVYPTWPEDAIKTIIYAVISNALRRIQSNHYKSKGYYFDITADGYFDQPYSPNRSIPVEISEFVDDMFNEFVTTSNLQAPTGFLFSPYHDKKDRNVGNDDEMYMDLWQVVELANQGLNPLEIIRALYGEQYFLPKCALLEGVSEVYPGRRLTVGSTGGDVGLMQSYLNQIADQFPTVLRVPSVNGVFDENMKKTVEEVQELFFLEPTGYIDKPTWYRIIYLYNRLKHLRELQIMQYQMANDDWSFPGELREGDHRYGVYQLQFMLNVIGLFLKSVPTVPMDSRFQKETKEAVMSFQTLYGLPKTGIVDKATWNQIYDIYIRDVLVLPVIDEVTEFSGTPITTNSSGEEVMAVQGYLNQLAQKGLGMDIIDVTGIFDEPTKQQVQKFQRIFNLPVTGIITRSDWESIVFQCVMYEGGKRYPKMNFKYPMESDYVLMIQDQLRNCHKDYRAIPLVNESDIYDEATVNAVKAFQRQFGLPQHGIVDKPTWLLLMKVGRLANPENPWLDSDIVDYLDSLPL